jgi:hypothetical protein
MNDGRRAFAPRLTRRSLLRAALGSSAFAAGSIAFGTGLRGASRQTLADRLAAILPATSAAAIGREYLRANPGEADPDAVVRRLVARAPGLVSARRASDRDVRAAVLASTRLDFRDGETVRIHGWILAQTEVLLCALVALRDGLPER